jgi:ribose transport system ATP-binding protein/rhamnose transport system ATP-binding protein
MLHAEGLSKTFGAVRALRGVSLSLGAGEVRAICGENGAGKSTLVKILMGVHSPDEGRITVDGVPRDIRSPEVAQGLGLALVAQELSLAPHLSILDNIWLGSREVPLLHRRAAFRARAREALAMLGADELDLDRAVATLSMGERQIVEIARGLARDARLLILDEPTATLSDRDIARLFSALRALRAERRSVLYITHRLGEVFDICDSVTVLRNGEHVLTLPVGEVSRERLIELMLGRAFAEMYPEPQGDGSGGTALVVQGLSIPGAVRDFSMEVPRGKIVCIAGQVGSGAAMITRALAGLIDRAVGAVTLDAAALSFRSAPACLARNVLFVSEDRAGEGLFPHMRVLDNLVALRLARHTRAGVLSWTALKRIGARLAERVRVDRERLASEAVTLSGGNQQKLLFGRALGREEAGVLLMNEPTRGVDVGARAEIYRLMRELCDAGWALVMTSSDLEEVVGMADIVITVYRGAAVGRYERRAISMPRILADITHPAQAAA